MIQFQPMSFVPYVYEFLFGYTPRTGGPQPQAAIDTGLWPGFVGGKWQASKTSPNFSTWKIVYMKPVPGATRLMTATLEIHRSYKIYYTKCSDNNHGLVYS